MFRLYNTLTRKVEDFIPQKPPVVTYYSCGPTVYDFAHIGHARTYVFADILNRVLKFNAYAVRWVMNITDVGHLTSDGDTGLDKMEKGAQREKKSVWDIAKKYTDDFFLMLHKLNIQKPDVICPATDNIPEMVNMIKMLEEKGYTYILPDGVYFDTSKFPKYGELVGKTFSDLNKIQKAGARVEMVEGKKHATDFALWKLTPKGVKRQMEWDSPWGCGFPGWHIECSAMSNKYLGDTIDIHSGGVDHIPIHHTNEIAQSEAATGKQFVRFWFHAQHLLVDNRKMSKSLNNFFRVSDLEEKGYPAMALRYLFLTSGYRTQMNFTFESLSGATRSYLDLLKEVNGIRESRDEHKRTQLSEEKLEKVNLLRDKFTQAVNDDLNTGTAIVVLNEVIKTNLPAEDKYDLIILFDEVLGLSLNQANIADPNPEIPETVKELVRQREECRRDRDFKKADELRQQIDKQGFLVEDTSRGPVITKKSIVNK